MQEQEALELLATYCDRFDFSYKFEHPNKTHSVFHLHIIDRPEDAQRNSINIVKHISHELPEQAKRLIAAGKNEEEVLDMFYHTYKVAEINDLGDLEYKTYKIKNEENQHIYSYYELV